MPSRDDAVTITCPICGQGFVAAGAAPLVLSRLPPTRLPPPPPPPPYPNYPNYPSVSLAARTRSMPALTATAATSASSAAPTAACAAVELAPEGPAPTAMNPLSLTELSGTWPQPD